MRRHTRANETDNGIGNWTFEGTYNRGVQYADCNAYRGRIYCVGGYTYGNETGRNVEYAVLNASESATAIIPNETPTTTINLGLTNVEQGMNTSQMFDVGTISLYSFAMPMFPYILVFVLTGIVAFKSKRGDLACFAGVVSALLLYVVYDIFFSIQAGGLIALAGVLALLTLLASLEMQLGDRPPKSGHI